MGYEQIARNLESGKTALQNLCEAMGKTHSVGTLQQEAKKIQKCIWCSPAEINHVTGNNIATNIADIPPLPDGWCYLVHRTRGEEVINSIKTKGIMGSGTIDGTTTCHDAKGLWEALENEPHTRYGDDYVISMMPSREYLKLFKNAQRGFYARKSGVKSNTDMYSCGYGDKSAYKLFVHPQYIVGVINRWFAKGDLPSSMFKALRQQSSALKSPEIKPVDLRGLNLGRPAIQYDPSLDRFKLGTNISGYNVTSYKNGQYVGSPENIFAKTFERIDKMNAELSRQRKIDLLQQEKQPLYSDTSNFYCDEWA